MQDLKKYIKTIDREQEMKDVRNDEELEVPFDWTGLKHTPDSIEKMRRSQTGVKPSKKTITLLKKQRKNKMWLTDGVNDFWVDKDSPIPEGQRRGRSTAKHRAPMSEEQKKKIAIARTGKKHTKETKIKMGKSRVGNQNARKKIPK